MKQYVLYDERALANVNDAQVLSTAGSLEEAREDKKDMFPNAVIYEYSEINNELVNGRLIE